MKSIHRLSYPFEEYGLHRIFCRRDHILQECLLLGVKSAQYIRSDGLLGLWMPNPNAEAGKCTASPCLDQRLHAIMSSIPSFLFDLNFAKDKIYVIVDD